MRSIFSTAAFSLLTISGSASAQDKDAIDHIVKTCVDWVHKTTPQDPGMAQFYRQFDAYYNSNTKRVINNGYRNGDVPAQYEFGKCMATHGLPLGGTE